MCTWIGHPPASPRPLPLKSKVTSVLLNMRRSATALAPSSAPTLHQPIFRVSTCREAQCEGSERGCSTLPTQVHCLLNVLEGEE